MTRNIISLFSALFFLLGFFGCSSEEDVQFDIGKAPLDDLDIALMSAVESHSPGNQGIGFFVLPEADDFSSIPQDPKNRLNEAKVKVGAMLFHEAALGSKAKNEIGMMTYSCASCHHAQAGFQANVKQGIGEGGIGFGLSGEGRKASDQYRLDELDIQPIRTPTTLNVAYQEVMLWNGQFGGTGPNAGTEDSWTTGTPKEKNQLGFQGVETQAIAGMEVHRQLADATFFERYPEYADLLREAFPDLPDSDRLSNLGAGLAMAAYERTLLPNEAPFQKWLKGDYIAMFDIEKRGALLFFGKAQCATCHTGPALNSMEFYALGMSDLDAINTDNSNPDFRSAHLGRGGFTGLPEDLYKFKVPQLYNLKDSRFYGHGASLYTIREVLEYKNNAMPEEVNPDIIQKLSPHFRPLNLSPEEIDALVAFVQESLFDANLQRYVPTAVLSGMCMPVNDPQARVDLGCR